MRLLTTFGLLIFLMVSCKKNESVTLDIHMDAEALEIDSLELMVKDIWIGYAKSNDHSEWKKIQDVNKLIAWHDFANTSDSLLLAGIVLENTDVVQQIRFVIDPSKSRGIMAMDTFNIQLQQTDLGLQALTNKKVEKNLHYKATLNWSMEETEWVDTIYQIKPLIKTTSFQVK